MELLLGVGVLFLICTVFVYLVKGEKNLPPYNKPRKFFSKRLRKEKNDKKKLL